MKGLAKFTTVEFIKTRYHAQDVVLIDWKIEQPCWEHYDKGKIVKVPKPFKQISLWFIALVEDTSSKKFFEAVKKDTGREQELKIIPSAFGTVGVVTKFKVEVNFKVEKGNIKE